MNEFKFYGALFLTSVVLLSLCFIVFSFIHLSPEYTAIFFIQSIYSMGCFVLLGLGIGFPLVLLATILGWVQLVLLMIGNVDPHLAQEGFFKVIHTLFNKI